MGMKNGTIRLIIDTTASVFVAGELLLQPPISNRFSRSDSLTCRLVLNILFRDAPFPTQPWLVLRGLPLKDQYVCAESPCSLSRKDSLNSDSRRACSFLKNDRGKEEERLV